MGAELDRRDETALTGEAWEPSAFDDEGAGELARRIDAAPPLVVPREALEGRVGIDDRQLWELGVRLAPPGIVAAGGGVVRRLAVLGAAAVGSFFAFCGVFALAGGGDSTEGLGSQAGLAGFFLVAAWAFGRLGLGAAARQREDVLARRRVDAEPVPPLEDPNARLTVAALDGPGVLRVLLLWLRGHPGDPDRVEVRVVAERRVPRDEPGRAEDAVDALSTVAMLGERLRTDDDARAVATTALDRSPLEARAAPAPRTDDPEGRGTRTPSRQRVGPTWQPDGTSPEGEAELARRLVLAKPTRWSGELLAPAIVTSARRAGRDPYALPSARRREREPEAPRSAWVTVPVLVGVAFMAFAGIRQPKPTETDISVGGRIAFLAIAAAMAAWAYRAELRELPHRLARRRLLRRVDDAATDAAVGLERALPGGHGAVVVAHVEEGGRHLVRLVHLRRVVDAPPGTVEARVVAEQALDPGDVEGARDAIGRFLLVADDEAFTAARGREATGRLRRLSRRLGVTSAKGGRGALVREPVGLLGAASGALGAPLAVAAAPVAIAGGEAAVGLVAAGAWLLGVAVFLVACARRWTTVPGA